MVIIHQRRPPRSWSPTHRPSSARSNRCVEADRGRRVRSRSKDTRSDSCHRRIKSNRRNTLTGKPAQSAASAINRSMRNDNGQNYVTFPPSALSRRERRRDRIEHSGAPRACSAAGSKHAGGTFCDRRNARACRSPRRVGASARAAVTTGLVASVKSMLPVRR